MKTAKEREEAFREALAWLLAKHGASINTVQSYDCLDVCCVEEVTMQEERDADGNTTAEYVRFEI